MVQLRCSRCARKVPMPRTSRADSDALTGTPCPTCVGDAAAGGAPTSAPTEAVLRLIYVFKLVLDDGDGTPERLRGRRRCREPSYRVSLQLTCTVEQDSRASCWTGCIT
eukprot:Em0099g2a